MKTITEEIPNASVEVEGLAVLSKSTKNSVIDLQKFEIKQLVDAFYQTQDARIRIDGQLRAIAQGHDDISDPSPEPMALTWVGYNIKNQENQIQKMLKTYVENNHVGQWAISNLGVGPILAAGLIASLEIEKAPHRASFWSYCGLNDNNIPWLGTAKGKDVVTAAYEHCDVENEEIDSLMKENLGNKEYKVFIRILKKVVIDIVAGQYEIGAFRSDIVCPFMYDDDIIVEGHNEDAIIALMETGALNILSEILDELDRNTADNMDDYLVRTIEAAAVTNKIIDRLSVNTGRKRDQLLTGVKNQINGKKKKPKFVNRTELAAFIAKPPYNLALKKLCWKLGDAFVKVSGKEESLYGQIYRQRKAMEVSKNESGQNAQVAANQLKEKNYTKGTDAYKALIEGKLPDGQIDLRARRIAVKMFLSHLYECMYLDRYHKIAEDPYPIAHMGHVDYVNPEHPFTDFVK